MIRHRAAAIITAAALALLAPVQATAAPVTPQEANSDQNTAYQVVDAYWRTHWSEYFEGRYTSPNVFGLYDSRLMPMPCDGSLWTSGNAWYCPSIDALGFDLAFMEHVYMLGDSFIYLVVAHEWGHAIQARLAPDVRMLKNELQADCLAGAALYGAAKDGALQWEEGDVDEITDSLTAVADQFPWTNVGDHGSPAERIAYFNAGADGPLACLPDLPPHMQPQAPDADSA